MKRRQFLASSLFALLFPPKFYEAFAGNRKSFKEALTHIESYLNSIRTLSASFLQVDPDGNVETGHLYLRRPGRLRFEYDEPSPLLIVADGIWLILYDKELGQVSRYPLYKSLLGLLIEKPADLQNKVHVTNIEKERDILRIKIISRDNPDDGWIILTFSEEPLMLRHWKIRDPQGGITTLTLNNTQVNKNLDPELFFFEDPHGSMK